MSEKMEITVRLTDQDLDRPYPLTGRQTRCLRDFQGKNLVLYFYPKDHTPGCLKEGKDFTRLYQNFLKLNTQIIGVSRDSIQSHESFKLRQNYSFDLLSDKEEHLCKTFKVLKKLIGSMSLLVRSTFILNSKSQVIYEQRKVKVGGHAEAVLDFIKNHPDP